MFKIPLVDELVRSVQSLGDAITGNTDAAAARWKNWTNDSFLGTGGKMVGFTVASGATALVGKTDKAEELIKKAGDNGEKFGANALSAVSQVGGIAAQAVTLGVPNPVSGALNGVASGINRVVDEDAQGGKNGISWETLGMEVGVGAAKGAASSGGIIPYAGTAVEQKIRGEEIEFDHKQEWASWGLNVGLSLATAGTAKGTAALTEAGKIGAKRAAAIGGSSGLAMGTGAAFISQEVHSAALDRRMRKMGYRHHRDVKCKDGKEYAVYTKEGEEDIYVPKPSKGDIVAEGLMQGVQGAAAGFQQSKTKQNKPLKQDYKKRLTEVSEIPDDHVVNRNDALTPANLEKLSRGPKPTPKNSVVFSDTAQSRASSVSSSGRRTEGSVSSVSTGNEIPVSPRVRNTPEFGANGKLSQQLGLQGKYLKVTRKAVASPDAAKGIVVLGDAEGRNIFLLQHASNGKNGKYGPISNASPDQIARTLRKAVVPGTETVNLLGCDVSPELASQLEGLYRANNFNVKVKTLPRGDSGTYKLEIDPANNRFRYWSDDNQMNLIGNLEELPRHLTGVNLPGPGC